MLAATAAFWYLSLKRLVPRRPGKLEVAG